MKKNPELAGRLQKIYDAIEKNTCETMDGWWDAMRALKDIIYEFDSTMFPDPVDGIKIERVTYFPGCEPANADTERRFAITKTVSCKPYEATDLRTGEKKVHTTNSYVIADLEWNEKEGDFDFESVGLRWIEAAPSKEVCDMILKFCNKMTKLYNEEDWRNET